MKKLLFVLLAVLFMIPSAVEARGHKHYRHHRSVVAPKPTCTFFCGQFDIPRTRGERIADHVGFGVATDIGRPVRQRVRYKHHREAPARQIKYDVPPAFGAVVSGVSRAVQSAATIVSHPSGCPSRAFCGCGAAVRVFGTAVRELWLAANWYKFPRAMPAAGMVAVRPHHVFVLEADLGNGVWQVYDANSGGHATRIHARSIAGYTIVNPHGGRYG